MVKIAYPEHAGRAKGPDVTVTWSAEEAKLQQISIDGKEYSDIPADARSFVVRGLAQGVHSLTILIDHTKSASTTFYVYRPVQLSPFKLYTLDLSSVARVNANDANATAAAFDTLHLVACLQGLVNRDRPRLYINYMKPDAFWLDKMRAKGSYLEHAELTPLGSVEAAISEFAGKIKGVVVWDPKVPSTNNVASTICGVENLLPIRFDPTPGSLHDRLVVNGSKLKIVQDLVGKFSGTGKIPGTDRDSTGSAKCDSYIWAKTHYIDTGKCNPAEIGYWCDAFWLQAPKEMGLDNVGLTNHDFVVARKGFLCDLGVWTDEAPRDDPNQRFGLDRETLCEILLSCYKANKGKMIHFSGFTPWAMKYTDHGNAGGKHGGVPTEWEMTRITSSYNAYVDADAIGYVGMANASVFQHYPLPDRLIQNPPPTRQDLEAKGYIDKQGKLAPLNFLYHYLGDYDSAAWLYHSMPDTWASAARGEVPSGWAFNPNLTERLPVLFDWVYETKSPMDYFVAGDSGAGYVNPTALLAPREISKLPSAAKAWIDHNIPYFRRLNYSIVGFIINAFCGELTDESNAMYTSFSGDGVMTQAWMPKDKKQDHLLDNMPVAHMERDIDGSPENAAQTIAHFGKPGETAFRGFRSILKSPDWIKAVNAAVRGARPDCRFEPVDPYTYFYLLRHSLGGSNDKRATYTFDTMPAEVKAGKAVSITAGLRNDGWDTWEQGKVVLTARFGDRSKAVVCQLPNDVGPGEAAVVKIEVAVPAKPGEHELTLELRRGSDGWFGDSGDLPWVKPVRVV
jgi:hypothetical protein